jgi:two-component system cell cycle sensor histidine kinase/response regulator CckA
MSDLHAGTMLAYLAGAALFACVVLAVYWGAQRVPPGFGLWTVSSALIAAGCVLLSDRGYFPRMLTTIVVPTSVALGAGFRLEGIRRFLGRQRLDRRTLLLPLVVVALLAVFTYAWDSASARSTVIAVAIAVVFWATSAVMLVGARRHHGSFLRLLAAVFAVYGALWFGTGIHWLVKGAGFPYGEVDTASVVFFCAVTAFEFFWVIACLVLSAKWSADALEAARSAAETERSQLADIVASLPDPTFALDQDRRVIAWNRLIEEMSGVSAKDILGKSWDEGGSASSMGREDPLALLLLDPAKAVPARYTNVKREAANLSADEEVKNPELPGKSRYLWHTAILLRDSDGKVMGVLESVRDMTWRIEAERAVRESEERYHSLFEHSLDGILVIAPGGSVIDANPAACRILGMTKEDLCAADPGSLIRRHRDGQEPSEERPVLGTAVQELSFVRGDGSTLPAECMSVVWNDASGHLRAFVQFRDISERLESQRILRESQARLLEAQATSRIGNWEIDLVANTIWLSPEALSIFGVERPSPYFALAATELTSLTEDSGILQSALAKVTSEGGSYDVEYRIRRVNDGALRTVRSTATTVRGQEGIPVKVVGATLDVTGLDRTGGLPDLAQYSLDHAGDQVFWLDTEGRFVFVSDSTCTQLGYAREELLGMTIRDVDPSVKTNWAENWEELKGSGSRRTEAVHRAKDGRDIPVDVSSKYVMHDGQEYGFVFARDISERKSLEEALRKTQLSLEHGSDLVFWTDPQGRLVFVTESTCEQLGYARQELLQMTMFDLEPAARAEWRAEWAKLVKQGTLTRETFHLTKDGAELPVQIVSSYVRHDGNDYAVVFARILGERGQEAEPLPKDGMELLQFQKLEAVGQLAGGIAHDFNNLLTAIIGYGNLILANEDAQGLKSLRRDAEEIRNAAERAAALTSQILAFARRQPLRPQVVSLGDLVAGLEGEVRPLVGDKIELVMHRASEAGFVEVDTEQFAQVVINLVRNAREAMPNGGRLALEVKNVELSEQYCRAYPELRAGAYVMLSVTDNGVGMDADTRMRIFEPFFTTKPPGEGTGLGLSMVYGTVRQSGGYVLVYSEVDKGTTLKVYLPRVTKSAESIAPVQPFNLRRKGNETIIVVDDEPPLRRLVARVLGELGYRVLVAGNGPEALELLEDMQEPPDLLITDVVLPGGLQGNELAREIASLAPGLPVLYMSGHPRDAIVHAGRLDQGVCFLGKPFTPQGLIAKVREVLGSPAHER